MEAQAITPELQVEIKNVHPIELLDLTNSLSALTVEFGEYISKHHPEVDASDVKLYVHEVRSGSVIATLAALSPTLMQGVSYAVTVGDFAEHLRCAFDWLLGRSEKTADASTASNLSQIVEPIAKDAGSQLNIGSLTASHGGVININYADANTVQNTARRFIQAQRQASSGIHEKVLMHWFQARADSSSKVGDRAIIEAIATKPVKTVCATDHLKARMVLSDVNPFQEAFLVDVVVETVNGRPAMYKIIDLHDRFLAE